MPNYVKVKFPSSPFKQYTYELSESLKIERLKKGDPIVVPVGYSNDLKVAVIVSVQESEVKIDPGFTIKKAYGLIRKI